MAKIKLYAGIGIGLLALLLFLRSFRSGPEQLQSTLDFACAKTGKVFRFPRERVNAVPFVNPDTGEATLVPIETRDGKHFVVARYREAITELGENARAVDSQTLEVKGPS